MKNFPLFALAVIASVFTITPVVAAGPATAIAIVSTADLDLGKAADVAKLDRRLTIAIVEACGGASNIDLEGRNAVRACRVDARAKVTVERDRLIALASRGGAATFASAR